MIYFMGLSAAFVMTFLPFWILPFFCFFVGFARGYDWCRAFTFAMIAGIIVIAVAIFKDFQLHGLISSRLGGLLQVPANAAPLAPGLMTIWIAVFFARTGASLRAIYKK